MSDEDLEMDEQLDEDESELESSDNSNNSSDDDDSKDEDLAAAADIAHSSLAARNKMRESMAADVEAFLSRGGQITQVDDNVMADPPRKPQTNYGSRPI